MFLLGPRQISKASQYFFGTQALEKNQQWLTYDQQREAYVQSVLARLVESEQQLAQAKQQPGKKEDAAADGETGKGVGPPLLLFCF